MSHIIHPELRRIEITKNYDFGPIYKYIFEDNKEFKMVFGDDDTDKCNFIKNVLPLTDRSGHNFLLWCLHHVPHNVENNVIYLLENFSSECNIEQVTDFGDTAFIWACENGLIEVIKKMVKIFGSKCKYGHFNSIGFTGFICACNKKTPDTALFLLNNLSIEYNTGHVAFMWACVNNLTEVIAIMVDKYPHLLNVHGYTPLIWACSKKSTGEGVLFLIDKLGAKCNVGHVSMDKSTALIYACKNDLANVALKLIDTFGTECSVGHADNDGCTALIYACKNSLSNVALKLIETFGTECKIGHANRYNETALQFACIDLKEVALKILELFPTECNIGQQNSDDHTALTYACANCLPEVALKILDLYGPECNVGAASVFGYTALMWTCADKMTDVALKILDKFRSECNLEHSNENCMTALEMAFENELTEVVAKILDDGVTHYVKPIDNIVAYLESKSSKKLKILTFEWTLENHFKDNEKINVIDYVSYCVSHDESNMSDEYESIDICVFNQNLTDDRWKEYLDDGFRFLKWNGEMIISESLAFYEDIRKHIDDSRYYVKKCCIETTNKWFYLHVLNDIVDK